MILRRILYYIKLCLPIASITLIGSMFGTMLSGVKSEVLGRKKAILTTHFVALLGFLSLRYANSVPMLYLGNFLGGYTEGVYLVVSPLYVSEINQPKIRKNS